MRPGWGGFFMATVFCLSRCLMGTPGSTVLTAAAMLSATIFTMAIANA
jgi:hypothetical protein